MIKKSILLIAICTALCLAVACGASIVDSDQTQAVQTPSPEAQPTMTPSPEVQLTATPSPEPQPSVTLSPQAQLLATYPQPGSSDFPSLYEEYKDYFSIGIGIVKSDISTIERADLIRSQFNSITCGNEMKADAVLDYTRTISEGTDECPVLNFAQADVILRFCQQNNIPVRGHTLVWHSQTPRWFFAEGYSQHSEAPLVSKELMLKRMENYIRQEMEYINTTYPGLVYAWDVVNEAVDLSKGVNGYRSENSLYYQVIGEEYIEKAFEFARKYADPEQKLFYNDFNAFESLKSYKIIKILQPLVDKGLVDGVGMQSHLKMDYPSLITFRTAVTDYAKLGVEIHITELDIDAKQKTEEEQMKLAKRYKNFFNMLCQLKDGGAQITNVTIWGLSDDKTWLNQDGDVAWPLLFDWKLEAKPAYWGVMRDEAIQ